MLIACHILPVAYCLALSALYSLLLLFTFFVLCTPSVVSKASLFTNNFHCERKREKVNLREETSVYKERKVDCVKEQNSCQSRIRAHN